MAAGRKKEISVMRGASTQPAAAALMLGPGRAEAQAQAPHMAGTAEFWYLAPPARLHKTSLGPSRKSKKSSSIGFCTFPPKPRRLCEFRRCACFEGMKQTRRDAGSRQADQGGGSAATPASLRVVVHQKNQHQPPGSVCGAERAIKASIQCAHAQATRTPFARSPARDKVQVARRVQAGHQKRVGLQRSTSGSAPQAERRGQRSRRFRASPQRLTPKQRSWRVRRRSGAAVDTSAAAAQLEHLDHPAAPCQSQSHEAVRVERRVLGSCSAQVSRFPAPACAQHGSSLSSHHTCVQFRIPLLSLS